MLSLKQCAVLATALVGSVAASPAHEHLHKKNAAPAPVEKRGLLDGIFKSICLEGHNVNSTGAPIALNDKGPYVVDFQNESDEEIGLVLWAASNQATSWTAFTVNVTPPNVTVSIAAGENLTVSFDPSQYTEANGFPGAAQSLSGAWSAIYKDTTADYSGGVKNTWGEFTFASDSYFSTVDVSRMVSMSGHDMTIQTFASKGGEQACVANMDTCVYVCPEGEEQCIVADCSNCDGNTGCMGMGPNSGYVLTTFH